MTILEWGAVTRAASGPAQRPGLPPAAAFWLVAGAWFLLLFAAAAPSPLYGVYQAQWPFSAITLTAVFGVNALGLLVALLVFGSVSDYPGRRRILTRLAEPGQRASLIAAIWIVFFLAFSVSVVIAGVATTHFGLHQTAGVYSGALAVLAAAAAGRFLLHRRPSREQFSTKEKRA